MAFRPRTGSRLPAAWGIFLIASAHAALSADAPVAAGAAAGPAPASLLEEIRPVLAHAYAGIDTAGLLSRIRERLQWGEPEERLIEAEGILHWDRGETDLAIPCFKQLAAPRPAVMAIMAEAMASRGEKYEAADWHLRAARALPPRDPEAVAQYRRYLSIRPDDARVELELADRLETQQSYGPALDLYWKDRGLLREDAERAARAADLLAVHGRLANAAAIADTLHAARPADTAWTARLARIRASMGDRTGAAGLWTEIWKRLPADSASLERAAALLEAAGPGGREALKTLLADAARSYPLSGDWHYRLAGTALAEGNRKAAYAQLDTALRLAPNHPAYLAMLPEAIEGDSLIRAHGAFLAERSARDPSSARLAVLAARGFSLAGDRPNACTAWLRAGDADPRALEGRRDAFLDLAACGDPASVRMAMAIGDRHLASGFDREAAITLIPLDLDAGDFGKAATYAARLASESPSDAPHSLDAARALLAAGRESEARRVLAAAADRAHLPEASLLLGRSYMAAGAWDSAAGRLREAREAWPEARRLLAECLAELKDYGGAGSEYAAHFAAAADRESLRKAAHFHRLAGDSAREAEALGLLVDSGWADEGERLRFGLARAHRGRAREAMAIFADLFASRRALPDGEDWREGALRYGLASAREGRLDDAIRALSLGLAAAQAAAPELAEPWMRLGECLAEKGTWREAYAAYASALRADPNSEEAAVEMLHAARRFEGRGEIADAVNAVYRIDSLNAEANEALGAGHQAAREYREAAIHYRRVARAHPADPRAWENLGNALAMVPDFKAASAPLQTALDLGAQSDEVFINRARAYRAAGEKDMAASILRFLLGRDPHDFLASLWSAKFAEEDGFPETATDLYRKTARLRAPHTPWPELAQARIPSPRETKTSALSD